MASKQETGIGAYAREYERAHDAAEKALGVEPWCRVTVERTRPDGTREVLHAYDMPRAILWDWQWVYEWRKARYVCKYPKDHVSLYFSFYDRRTGLAYETESLRSRQVAAKALITRYTKALEDYLAEEGGKLFFDPDNDPAVIKAKAKIASAECRLQRLTQELESLLNPS
jgi:hypothetical protein